MDTKKFVKLTPAYRKLLDDIRLVLNTDITNETKFKTIDLLYQKVNDLVLAKGLETSDINHLITNYTGSDADQLKALAAYRNLRLIKAVVKSDKWVDEMASLATKLSRFTKSPVKPKDAEKALIHIVSDDMALWDGCWHILEINKNGTLKCINLMDPSYNSKMVAYLTSLMRSSK